MRIAYYTAVVGEYDDFRDPVFMDEGVDYYVFSDQKINTYSMKNLKIDPSGYTRRKTARCIKALSHKFLPQYDVTIWADGNFCQKESLLPLLELMTEDILIMNHPSRNCTYKEGEAVGEMRLEDSEVLENQMEYYKFKGLPAESGMVGSGFIIRKNNPEINKLNEDWWTEISCKSGRDQLSFNYCAWKNKIKYNQIPFDWQHKYFNVKKHRYVRQTF